MNHQLFICDSGGVNEAHNSWLRGRAALVSATVRVASHALGVQLEPGAGNPASNDQWRVQPSTLKIRDWLISVGQLPTSHDAGSQLSHENTITLVVTEP